MANYWSYNFRTGGMHDYTEEEFQRAKKSYKLQECCSFPDCPQEDSFTYWATRDMQILFLKKEDDLWERK